MEILHVSAECYPMAKAGGLADVVGALPKYQCTSGNIAKVVMPMHRTQFLYNNEWEVVHKGSFAMGNSMIDFTIIKEKDNKLGFDLYCVDINGLLDREKIYGYDDDTDRFLAFQISVTEWLSKWQHQPDIIHVHDHHAALIPFMLRNCFSYQHLAFIKTVLTIHNAQYQGWMGWDKAALLPAWDTWKWGLLEWNNTVNPLACGVKCADRVTTVSPGYLKEMQQNANGLEALFRNEAAKCFGIINGIDVSVWNPETDTYIMDNFNSKTQKEGKHLNKKKLCDDFTFDLQLPLFIFIGRFVHEKAADLLAPAFNKIMRASSQFNILVLGSGDNKIEKTLLHLNEIWKSRFCCVVEYNEKLSHQMYAGADFLLMPSRVEPCGLNQLYSMRYGTIPVVRSVGGLKDTVIDVEEENGYGITFLMASEEDIIYSMNRALKMYENKKLIQSVRTRMMGIDNSWQDSVTKYMDVYSK